MAFNDERKGFVSSKNVSRFWRLSGALCLSIFFFFIFSWFACFTYINGASLFCFDLNLVIFIFVFGHAPTI
jgi:hypothetical protein